MARTPLAGAAAAAVAAAATATALTVAAAPSGALAAAAEPPDDRTSQVAAVADAVGAAGWPCPLLCWAAAVLYVFAETRTGESID